MFPTPGNSPPYTTNDGKKRQREHVHVHVLRKSNKLVESESTKFDGVQERNKPVREERGDCTLGVVVYQPC